MSVSEQPVRLALHTVDDLVGLVPYLIGFHPEQSLVVLVIDGGHVAVTARVDLVAVTDPAALDALVERLFSRFPAAEAWFLAFTDDVETAWDVLAGCVEQVGIVRLGRVLQVGTREWRADFPDGPTGPITGRVSPAVAEAAVLGMAARPSRRELATGICGPPEEEVDDLAAEFEVRARELDRVGSRGRRRLMRRLLRTAGRCRLRDCVRLAVLADNPEGRETALRELTHDTAEQQLALWTQVVRRSLPPWRPAVVGLLGMAAWQTGDGAMQVVCLEELDRIDPASLLAAVIDHLNRQVVPPWEWDGMRERILSALAEFTAADPRATREGR